MPERKGFPEIDKVLGAATALLAAVGVGTGVALRMLRNFPLLLMLFVLVIGLGTLLPMLSDRRGVRVLGFSLFLLGLGLLTWLAGESSQAKERPLIIASSETTDGGLTKVTSVIRADGLTMKELVYVAYRGSRRVPVDPVTGRGGDRTGPRSLLGEAAFGPNADGKVEGEFTFEVSPSLYWDVTVMASRHRGLVERGTAEECIPFSTIAAKRQDWGCARFVLPLAPIRPVVSGSVAGNPRTMTANVSAGGVPPSKLIVVKTWAGSRQLLKEALGPDLSGAVKATLTTTVKPSTAEICIVAALVPSSTHPTPNDVTRALCDGSAPIPETVGVATVQSY